MHTASFFRAFARRRAALLAAALFFASSAVLADLRIGVAVGPFDPYIAYPLSALQDRATLQVEDSAGDPIRPRSAAWGASSRSRSTRSWSREGHEPDEQLAAVACGQLVTPRQPHAITAWLT